MLRLGGSRRKWKPRQRLMDLDEEAIDSLADLITGEKLTSEDAEQRSARLEASKARLKLVRKDVATQLAGVRKRIRKGA